MHKLFELVMEIIGWIRVMISPLLGGSIIGIIIYYNFQTVWGLIVAMVVAIIGLVVGIIWATRIWKKYGTMRFISRISATPELDKVDDKEN